MLRSIQALSKCAAKRRASTPLANHRVQETRPVHVHAQVLLVRKRGERVDFFKRPDRAPTEVRALLHRNQRGAGHVAVAGAYRRACLRGAVDAGPAVHRVHGGAGPCGGAARLQHDEVRGAVGDHLVTGTAVHLEGDFVAHGARGQEHRGLLAEQRRHPVAERIHARVPMLLLVSYRRFGHRTAHLRSGEGLGVAVEVDHGIVSAGPCREIRKRGIAWPARQYRVPFPVQQAPPRRSSESPCVGEGSVSGANDW